MKETIVCPNCGYKNKATYKYCIMCFERLHYSKFQSTNKETYTLRRVVNITKILFVIIVVLIFLIFARFQLVRF